MFYSASISLSAVLLILTCVDISVAESCGGVVNETQGEITFLGRPDANITCVWYVLRTQDKYVIFNIEELQLDGQESSLQIYSGNSTADVKTAELVSNLTSGSELRTVLIGSNVATVILFTGEWAEGNKTANFRLRYETKPDCAQSESIWSTKIETPLYDKAALPLKCSYNFTTENPNRNLTLSFSAFDVTGGTVTLKNNNTTLASLSGTSIPKDFFIKGSNLLIEFNTNSSKTNEFTAVLNSVDPDCLQHLTLGDWGVPVPLMLSRTTLSSPLTCQWVITSPANGTVRVSLDESSISSVRVLVSDGESLFGGDRQAYLGLQHSGTSFVSSGETLSLYVSVDSALQNGEIKILATAQKFGGIFMDNGTLEGDGGETDGSSSWYYYLNVPLNEKVRFEMTDSSLYPATSITCYDGTTETDPVLAQFRSDLPFYPVISSGPQMLVVASNLQLRGFFTANFSGETQVCDAISEGSQGHYQGQVKHDGSEVKGCSWVIQPSKEDGVYLLRASMKGFKLLDNLTVYDGLSEYNNNILLVRGDNSSDKAVELPVIVIPAMNGARLMYSLGVQNGTNTTSDSSTRTVKADYTFTTEKLCGGELPTDSTGNIYTPFYPNERYPLNVQCHWNTTVHDGKLFYISFNTFQLDPKHSVSVTQYVNNTFDDSVNADDSNLATGTQFNGSVAPSDVIFHGPHVNITFTSEESHQGGNSGQGFNISYRTIDSGGVLSSKKGTFSTPDFPTSVSSTTESIWIINLAARKDNSSSVQIVQFDLDLESYSKISRNNTLEFRDGNSHNAPLSTFNLTNGKLSSLYSRTNQLWIRYLYKLHKSPSNAPGFAFKLTYSTYVCPLSQQCKNGICMQPDWKCNGIDECGDESDEQNCSHTITTTTGVAGFVVAILFILGLLLGVLGALVAPAIYKRIRYPNYRHLRDVVSPIDA